MLNCSQVFWRYRGSLLPAPCGQRWSLYLLSVDLLVEDIGFNPHWFWDVSVFSASCSDHTSTLRCRDMIGYGLDVPHGRSDVLLDVPQCCISDVRFGSHLECCEVWTEYTSGPGFQITSTLMRAMKTPTFKLIKVVYFYRRGSRTVS